jgi:pilus assembly protein Flp/PilA
LVLRVKRSVIGRTDQPKIVGPIRSCATAIEYGLLAAGIALVNGMGTKLNTKFTSINSSLK